jgi:hypothetical protein
MDFTTQDRASLKQWQEFQVTSTAQVKEQRTEIRFLPEEISRFKKSKIFDLKRFFFLI